MPKEIARKVDEEVAGIDRKISSNVAKTTLLTWMVGTNVALTIGVLMLVFNLTMKLH